MKNPTHSCGRMALVFASSVFAISVFAISVFAISVSVSPIATADETESLSGSRRSQLTGFLEQHCVDCHGPDSPEADLNIADLVFEPADKSNHRRWVAIFDRVRSGEMPPKGEPRPDPAKLKDFLDAVAVPLIRTEQDEYRQLGRVRSRRLNRIEYENTMHDLLGIDIPLREFLPEDTFLDGFSTVAQAQQVSHHLLEKYLDAADASLDEAFDRALNPDGRFVHTYTSRELGRRSGQRDPWHVGDETIAWSCNQVYHGRVPETEIDATGWYRITLHDVHSVNAKPGEGIWCTMRTGVGFARAPLMYTAGIFRADENRRDQTFEAWIRQGHLIEARPADNTLRKVQGNRLNNYKGSVRDKRPLPQVPGLAYSAITLESIHLGPAREEVAKLLFGEVPVDENKPRSEIARLMKLFANRAFRRPVPSKELAPYLAIVDEDIDAGIGFYDALKRGYRSILCSPRFLYLNELPGELDDYAIASRLSYFLWSSNPDATLLSSAAAGELVNEQTRRPHVERMLNDDRAQRLTVALADQWLNLREIDLTSPDSSLYPEFDETLQLSMLAETKAFLGKLIQENLPAANIIDSDFAMLNERLAKHYGIPGIDSHDVRAVSLAPEQHRGGLITQGAILKVTANGTTTSPVVRGAFINERILGVKIPPPPDNVPAIEPDIRGAISIRDQLAKHSNQSSCAACHIKIDPPGFALESYDVIGGWRTHYRTTGRSRPRNQGIPVAPHHQMPTGDAFDDIEQFKAIILRNPDQIARNFTHHLMTYATGASVSFSDRQVIEDVLEKTKAEQYGVRSLIRAVIDSPAFLNK
jgi:hypothetical protein